MLTPKEAELLKQLIKNAFTTQTAYVAEGRKVSQSQQQWVFAGQVAAEAQRDLEKYIQEITAQTEDVGVVRLPQGEYSSTIQGAQGTRSFTPFGNEQNRFKSGQRVRATKDAGSQERLDNTKARNRPFGVEGVIIDLAVGDPTVYKVRIDVCREIYNYEEGELEATDAGKVL